MSKKILQQEREEWRRREYRRLILKAAERVIVHKGLAATTMDDIAREAEFSKATLYHYFQGKSGLLLEIMANFYDEIAQGIQSISLGTASAGERLKNGLRFYLEYNEQKENIARMLWMDREFRERVSILAANERSLTSEDDVKFLDDMKQRRRSILDSVARIIEDGVAAGEFREVDVACAVTALEAMIQGFCYLRSWHDRAYTVQEATDFFYDFILRGMAKAGSLAKGES